MTQEEAQQLQQQLAQQGVQIGQWFGVQEGVMRHKSMEDQKTLLVQLRDLLEGQLSVNMKQLDDAMRQLERSKHGGGQ